MKRRDGFLLREVAGTCVVVPFGERSLDFGGMVTLNETARFLWELLEHDTDERALLLALTNEYEIDEETAGQDIRRFLTTLQEGGCLE